MVDTRCTSGGIEHSFVNYLVYTNKLRSLGCGIRIYPHAEGTVNSLGGLRPDTVVANITGTVCLDFRVPVVSEKAREYIVYDISFNVFFFTSSYRVGDIKSFWKVLNDDGEVLNWSGEVC